MECCFAPKRKNKAPVRNYEAFEPNNISQIRKVELNNIQQINEEIENKQKIKKLSQITLKIPEETIPFPPKSPNISIAI
jgi:hypothetical protein